MTIRFFIYISIIILIFYSIYTLITIGPLSLILISLALAVVASSMLKGVLGYISYYGPALIPLHILLYYIFGYSDIIGLATIIFLVVLCYIIKSLLNTEQYMVKIPGRIIIYPLISILTGISISSFILLVKIMFLPLPTLMFSISIVIIFLIIIYLMNIVFG